MVASSLLHPVLEKKLPQQLNPFISDCTKSLPSTIHCLPNSIFHCNRCWHEKVHNGRVDGALQSQLQLHIRTTWPGNLQGSYERPYEQTPNALGWKDLPNFRTYSRTSHILTVTWLAFYSGHPDLSDFWTVQSYTTQYDSHDCQDMRDPPTVVFALLGIGWPVKPGW